MASSTPRPHWARDYSRVRPYGQIPPGIRENFSFYHIVPVIFFFPPRQHLDAANRGEVWGSASVTVCGIYVRLDLRTNQLWFLEYKSTSSQAYGCTKTLKWFDEDGARTRWWTNWHSLHENAGMIMPVAPMCILRPDASFNYGPMKVQYRGIQFTMNTPNVGGPNMANIHDGVMPQSG